MSVSYKEFKIRENLSLDDKIRLSQIRIQEFYNYFCSNVYLSNSMGKESTVMAHIANSMYPNIPNIFCDTGLEYPEIRKCALNSDTVIIKPKISFRNVLEKYGYPLVSKENAQILYEIRRTKSPKLLYKRLNGDNNKYKSGKLPDKWKFLIKAPFKISHKCCDILKKNPFKKYEQETKRYSIIGIRATDSRHRMKTYLNHGCNAFDIRRPSCRPLGFWRKEDIWKYIEKFNLQYCKIYDMGYESTGCIFCAFGIHKEKSPNRFELLKKTHPKLWKYCIHDLGMGEVLDYVGVKYEEKYRQLTLNLM